MQLIALIWGLWGFWGVVVVDTERYKGRLVKIVAVDVPPEWQGKLKRIHGMQGRRGEG